MKKMLIEKTPWMSKHPDGTTVAPVSDDALRESLDVVDVERETGGGGVSADVTREASMAPPRWIPAPDSPPLSVQLPPEPSVEDMG